MPSNPSLTPSFPPYWLYLSLTCCLDLSGGKVDRWRLGRILQWSSGCPEHDRWTSGGHQHTSSSCAPYTEGWEVSLHREPGNMSYTFLRVRLFVDNFIVLFFFCSFMWEFPHLNLPLPCPLFFQTDFIEYDLLFFIDFISLNNRRFVWTFIMTDSFILGYNEFAISS